MILTCPSCSMRYLVADSAVPPEGRSVRCAACHHEWFQDGPQPETFEQILEKEVTHPVEPIPDAVKPIPEGSSVPARPEDIPPPDKADHTVLFGRLAGYAAAACVCALLMGTIIAMRAPIAKAWPPSLLLFDLVGAPVPLPGDGLIIDRIKAVAQENSKGQASLKVQGTVINLKSEDKAVPRILATLWRADGTAMESWIIDLPHARVDAEKSFDFEAEYPGVPPEATSVNLSFAAFMPKKTAPAAEKETTPVEDAHHDDAAAAKAADTTEEPAEEGHDAGHAAPVTSSEDTPAPDAPVAPAAPAAPAAPEAHH